MEFTLTVNGKRRVLRLETVRDASGRWRASVDGHGHDVDAIEVEPGVFSLLVDGVSFEAAVAWRGPDEAEVSLFDGEYEVQFQNPLRAALGAAAGGEGAASRVVAPMPGKVTRVMVKPGDRVEKGQPLVAVEAMKMENELRSPRAGEIESVHAAVGAVVEKGALLVVVR